MNERDVRVNLEDPTSTKTSLRARETSCRSICAESDSSTLKISTELVAFQSPLFVYVTKIEKKNLTPIYSRWI